MRKWISEHNRYGTVSVTTPYKLVVPLDSKGKVNTKIPAAMNRAPLTYTGAEVAKFANMAIIGCAMRLVPICVRKSKTYGHDTENTV